MKNDRKLLSWLFIGIMVIPFLSSCEDDEVIILGNWIEQSDFEGVPRSSAVSFTIGDLAYVGLGFDGDDRLSDFWSYDANLDSWRRIADFPGNARNGAVAFGINNKGYLGTGYDGENKLSDFWSYDPTTDSWEQKADFAGSARYGAVGVSLNGKGYIGTGYDDNYLKDFWEYDPSTDAWTQKLSVGGSKRRDAATFALDNKIYICCGVDNGVYEDDFWAYDPTTELWTGLRDIANTSEDEYDDEYNIVRINTVALAANGKAWIISGGANNIGSGVWEYEPISDLWEEKNMIEGAARLDAVGFVLNETAYLTTGSNSSYFFDDLWKYEPDVELNEYDK